MKFSVSDFIKVTVAIATFMTASSPDAKAQSETEVLILGTAPLSQVDGFNQDANSHWSALIISKTNPSCFPDFISDYCFTRDDVPCFDVTSLQD
jgi:hypothetical protein